MRDFINIVLSESAMEMAEHLLESFEPEDGCWIKPNGEILACDRMNDLHHNDIVANHFGHDESENDYDENDYDEDGEYYGDDDPTEIDQSVFEEAFDAGWIRVGQMGGAAYAQLPNTPTPKSLRKLAKVAKQYTGYNHYTIEGGGRDVQHFNDHRAFMVGIARLNA